MATSSTIGFAANQPFIFDQPLVISGQSFEGINSGTSGTSNYREHLSAILTIPNGISDVRVNFIVATFSLSMVECSPQQGEYSNAYNNPITIEAAVVVLSGSGNVVSGPSQLTFNNG